MVFVAAAASPTRGAGQSHYYNLDGGRPTRVEDAEATALYSVDVDLAPFSVERLSGGTMRYRAEPKASYGVLPFTEIELRIPYVRVAPPAASGAPAVNGVAGVAIGALHSFNLETADVPAVALGAEISLPVGSLAPTRTSFLATLLATKTTGAGRLHFNAGAGTYAVQSATTTGDTSCINSALSSLRILRAGDRCAGPPIIVDTPCSLRPAGGRGALSASAMCMPPTPSSGSSMSAPTQPQAQAPAAFGPHWFAGLGVDHAFPLVSSLITADIFAEKFVGLYPLVDWTAEVGMRREVAPSLVVDAGVGWHFAGTIRSTKLVVGAMYEIATAPLIGR
jgi:hypothetical protein